MAVTRGSRAAAQSYWDSFGKGSSSSLSINKELDEDDGARITFKIGWRIVDGHQIHVLDEATL